MKFDFNAPTVAASSNLKLQKEKQEKDKIDYLSETYDKKYLSQLCEEYNDVQSREAKFVKLMDKLEAMLHILRKKAKGFKVKEDFDFIIQYADKYIEPFPEISTFLQDIKNQLKALQKQI